MTDLERISERSGKSIYLLQLARWEEWPSDLGLPAGHFGLFVAGDAGLGSTEVLRNVARQTLHAGLVYLSAWGPACESLHDLFDDCIVDRDSPEDVESVIMTTWHDRQSLSEALEFFVDVAEPAKDYRFDTRAWMIVVVGSARWAQEVRTFLREADPDNTL